MAIELNTARHIVRESAINIGMSSFDDAKVDYAIMNAGHHFMRLTNASIVTTSVSLSSGVNSVDLTSTISGFTENDFELAEIDNYEVRHTTPMSLRRRFQGSETPKGRPSLIGFVSDNKALFDKQTDQSYTMDVTHAERFTSFTAGTASNPELNLPDEYAHAVLWLGARYYFLHGVPGHPDSSTARDEFFNTLREAIGKYGGVGTGVMDTTVPASMSGRGRRMAREGDS